MKISIIMNINKYTATIITRTNNLKIDFELKIINNVLLINILNNINNYRLIYNLIEQI